MGNQPSGQSGSSASGGGHPHHGHLDPRNGPGGTGYGYNVPPGEGVSHSYHDSTKEPRLHQQQMQQPQAMQRTSSDASMTILDPDPSGQQPALDPATFESFLNNDSVPTVFRWEHGGRQVYITGTFNGWSRQIPMHRSGNDFTYIHNLKRGKHAFKFIVDDEWRFAPDQPTVADIEGRINNFIDVTDFKAYTGDREFEKEKAAAAYGYSNLETELLPSGADPDSKEGAKIESSPVDDVQEGAISGSNKPDRDGEVYSNTMPDMDDYTKEPPPLPPHLRHIILNKPPQLQDTAALPVPQHVALNHLYCTAIKDNMMVLGITQRYKTKFVTTVYYSPCANN
jgi:5'-AMP-activated protein kinase, regulatory beta subunit